MKHLAVSCYCCPTVSSQAVDDTNVVDPMRWALLAGLGRLRGGGFPVAGTDQARADFVMQIPQREGLSQDTATFRRTLGSRFVQVKLLLGDHQQARGGFR